MKNVNIKILKKSIKIDLPKNAKAGEVYEKIKGKYLYNAAITFETNKEFSNQISDSIDVKYVINKLELFFGEKIVPGETLIFFDEIQANERALTSLKYFYEDAPEYHIIAAGSLLGIASYAEMEEYVRLLIIIPSVIAFIAIAFVMVKIEQVAGYYECQKCYHKYVPKYSSVLWAMHINRTRYMKCPKCNKRSWQKKVIIK